MPGVKKTSVPLCYIIDLDSPRWMLGLPDFLSWAHRRFFRLFQLFPSFKVRWEDKAGVDQYSWQDFCPNLCT